MLELYQARRESRGGAWTYADEPALWVCSSERRLAVDLGPQLTGAPKLLKLGNRTRRRLGTAGSRVGATATVVAQCHSRQLLPARVAVGAIQPGQGRCCRGVHIAAYLTEATVNARGERGEYWWLLRRLEGSLRYLSVAAATIVGALRMVGAVAGCVVRLLRPGRRLALGLLLTRRGILRSR